MAGEVAYVTVTPSCVAFPQFDDDHDGLLDVGEVASQRARLLAHFVSRFDVANQSGESGARTLEDVSTPHAHDALGQAGADHLRFTLRYQWPLPPTALRVQWRDAREVPLSVDATRALPSRLVHEQVAIGSPEHVVLDGYRPAHVFLGSAESPRISEAALGPWGLMLLGLSALASLVYVVMRRRASPSD